MATVSEVEAQAITAVWAQVTQANIVCVGKDRIVTGEYEDENGEIVPITDEVPVYAAPGAVIDVSAWASVGAYVELGRIRLLQPEESKAHVEALLAEASAAKPARAPKGDTKPNEEA